MKMKKWARAYVKTGHASKAAKIAYPGIADSTAVNIAYKNIRHPYLQEYITEILDKEGVTDTKIARSLNKVIDAGMTTRSLKETKPGDALRALELVAKLKDIMPAERKITEARNLNLNLDGKSPEELNQSLDELVGEVRDFQKMVKKTEEMKKENQKNEDTILP